MQRIINHAYRPNSLLIIAMSSAAVAVNFFGIALFDDNQIVLGNAFAIALTIIYGLRIGLPVAFICSLVTLYHWQHAFGIVPFVVEVIAVAIAMRREKSVLLFGVLYWLTLGWMLVALLYGGFGDYSSVMLYGIMLKYVLNGMFNVLLGFALFHALRSIKAEPHISFRTNMPQMLVNTGLFIVLFVASVVIYFWLRAVTVELYSQTEKQTKVVTELIADRTEAHFAQHLIALGAASKQLSADPAETELQRSISAVHALYPEFITLLVTNDRGDIIATSPAGVLEQQALNVADRDYFYTVKENQQPFISNAFRGRGFGNDPIVAVSVPYYYQQRFAGIIEGSLDLTLLAGFDGYSAEQQHYYIITDSTNQVVYASPQFGFDFLDDLSSSRLLHSANNSMMMNLSNGLQDFIMARQTIPSKGWQVITAGSMADYEKQLSKYLFGSMLLLVVLASLSSWAIHRLTAKLTTPITELAKKLQQRDDPSSLSALTATGTSRYIEELTVLQQSFGLFASRLRETLADLRRSNSVNSELNMRLQQANELLEERVQQRTEQLEIALHSASAANNAKSQFLANISHEVRTPLHGVLGLTELLLHDPKAEPFFDKLKLIEQSGQHLLNIVDDILDFAKIESGKLPLKPTDTDIIALISQLLTSYQNRLKSADLSYQLETTNVPEVLLVDQTRLRQIVDNLLSNAAKFSGSGGVITIHISYTQPLLSIAVSDTGIGIAPERIEAIFAPFEQADSSTTKTYGGTGLGLTISRQLARLMGGELSCVSRLGDGACFTLTVRASLPAH